MLVDSHCHLDFPGLCDNVRDVLDVAARAEVKILQTVCTSIKSFPNLLKITEQFAGVFCSVGLHPSHVRDGDAVDAESIVRLCNNPKVTGIGETGLDYHCTDSDHIIGLQQYSFAEHIKAAQKTQLPLIIHTRDAEQDTLNILREQIAKCHFKGVIHCFTSNDVFAEACLELGFYISASGIVTFKNAKGIQEIFKKLPLDRILIETDAPFLAPVPYRGKMNQPAYVREIAKHIADLRKISYEEFAHATTQNFLRLFNKVVI
ncbi:putative metal-dependent hydrolase YcfH [Alphaproteobacteria bacterium]